MLTLSLVLLTFACGGRKSEPVEAPAMDNCESHRERLRTRAADSNPDAGWRLNACA